MASFGDIRTKSQRADLNCSARRRAARAKGYKKIGASSTPFTGWFPREAEDRLQAELESDNSGSMAQPRVQERVMMRKNWPEISSAFAIGLGVGAVIGMMWAPKSGEETRALLREKAQDGIDEAVAQGKRVARQAQRAADSAKEFVNEAVDAGQNAYREARNS